MLVSTYTSAFITPHQRSHSRVCKGLKASESNHWYLGQKKRIVINAIITLIWQQNLVLYWYLNRVYSEKPVKVFLKNWKADLQTTIINTEGYIASKELRNPLRLDCQLNRASLTQITPASTRITELLKLESTSRDQPDHTTLALRAWSVRAPGCVQLGFE